MRESLRLIDFDIHKAADFVVDQTRMAKFFDRRTKESAFGFYEERQAIKEARRIVNMNKPTFAFGIEAEAVEEFERITRTKQELLGAAAYNSDAVEALQRNEQSKIIQMLPNQPLYMREALNIVNNGFELDKGNSLE